MAGKGSKAQFSFRENKKEDENNEYIQTEAPEENLNFDLDDFGGDFGEDDDLFAKASDEESIVPAAYAGQATETLEGFDNDAGRTWIYPVNYPLRDYQFSIVQKALFNNTLVSLPTGLGKTFIAAVVMYNFYRWYPSCKIVFMAPTKPLVAQQIEACFKITGTPQTDTAEMTGAMHPPQRLVAWAEKRIFFLTPQVLTNDLTRGACPAKSVMCVVLDEAHRATGNHSYCQVVNTLKAYGHNFRILALSATPGSDMKAVQSVIQNLLISNIELRSEDSPDISKYTHQRNIDKILIPIGGQLQRIQDRYMIVVKTYVTKLIDMNCLYTKDETTLSKFQILKAREAFRQNPPENVPRNRFGVIEGLFALCMTLYHAYELLMLHGTRSFYKFLRSSLDDGKAGATKGELLRNKVFTDLMADVRKLYGENLDNTNNNTIMNISKGNSQIAGNNSLNNSSKIPYVPSHPKIEKLQEVIIEHFQKFEAEGSSTRVMIFSQYRESVAEITEMLQQHSPLVKAYSFVGQSSSTGSTRGFSQKEQLLVVKKFREGGFNTLVATCVGEEGLDIGEVDLIVCYDSPKSPIRMVQRMGRTGRKREGRIVVLLTKGREEQMYNQSQFLKNSINASLMDGSQLKAHFYKLDARMIPKGLNPICQKLSMNVGEWESKKKPSRKSLDGSKTDSKNKSKTGLRQIDELLNLGAKPSMKKKSNLVGGYLSKMEWQWYKDNLRLDDTDQIKTLPEPQMVSLGEPEDDPLWDENVIDLGQYQPWQTTLQPTVHIGHSERSKHLVQLTEFLDLQVHFGPGEDPYGMEMATYLDRDYLEDEEEPSKQIVNRSVKSPKTSKRTENNVIPSKQIVNRPVKSPKTSKRTENNVIPKKTKKTSNTTKSKTNQLITDMFRTQSQQNRNIPNTSEDIEDFDMPKQKKNNSILSEKASDLLEYESDNEELPDIIYIPSDETCNKVNKSEHKDEKTKTSFTSCEEKNISENKDIHYMETSENSSAKSIDEIFQSVISQPLSPVRVRTPPREDELDDWDMNEPVEKDYLLAIVNQYEERSQANRKPKLMNFTDMISGEDEKEMEIEEDNEIEMEIIKERKNTDTISGADEKEMEIEEENDIEMEIIKEIKNVTNDDVDKINLSHEELPDLHSQILGKIEKNTENKTINICDSLYKSSAINASAIESSSLVVTSKLACTDMLSSRENAHQTKQISEITPEKSEIKCLSEDDLSPIISSSYKEPLGKNLALCSTPKANARRLFKMASPNLTTIESRSPAVDNVMKPSTDLEIEDDQFVPLSLRTRINSRLGKFAKGYSDGNKEDQQNQEKLEESKTLVVDVDRSRTNSKILENMQKRIVEKNRESGVIPENTVVQLSHRSRIRGKLKNFTASEKISDDPKENVGRNTVSIVTKIDADENRNLDDVEETKKMSGKLSKNSRIRSKLSAFSKQESDSGTRKTDTTESKSECLENSFSPEKLVKSKVYLKSTEKEKYPTQELETVLKSTQTQNKQVVADEIVNFDIGFDDDLFADMSDPANSVPQATPNIPDTKDRASPTEDAQNASADLFSSSIISAMESDCVLETPTKERSSLSNNSKVPESKNIDLFNDFATPKALPMKKFESSKKLLPSGEQTFVTPKAPKELNESRIKSDMNLSFPKSIGDTNSLRAHDESDKLMSITQIVDMVDNCATPRTQRRRHVSNGQSFSQYRRNSQSVNEKSAKNNVSNAITSNFVLDIESDLVGNENDSVGGVKNKVNNTIKDESSSSFTPKNDEELTFSLLGGLADDDWDTEEPLGDDDLPDIPLTLLNTSQKFNSTRKPEVIEEPKNNKDLEFDLGLDEFDPDDSLLADVEMNIKAAENLLPSSHKRVATRSQRSQITSQKAEIVTISDEDSPIKRKISSRNNRIEHSTSDEESPIKRKTSIKNNRREIISDDDSPIKRKISSRNNRIEDSQPAPASQLEVSEVWKRRKRKTTNIVESDSDDHNSSATSVFGKSDDSRNHSANTTKRSEDSRNNSMDSRNESADSRNQSSASRTHSDHSSSSTDHTKEWVSKKKTSVTNKMRIDDDDDFHLETSLSYKKQKPKDKKDSLDKKSKEQKAKKKKKKRRGNQFLEHEADISSGEDVSTDESEDDSDEYDDSFVNEGSQLSQDPRVDMQAVYLQSVVDRDEETGLPKRPRLPRHEILSDSTSASGEEEEDSCDDSFVVENDFVEYNSEWMGDTMLAEDSIMIQAIHDNAKRQKGKNVKNKKGKSTTNAAGNNKRKRIITHDTSSDEEAKIEKKSKVSKSSENIASEVEILGSKNNWDANKLNANDKTGLSGPSNSLKLTKKVKTLTGNNDFNFDQDLLDFDADDSLLADMQSNIEMGDKIFKSSKPTSQIKTMENNSGKMLSPAIKNIEKNWVTPKMPVKKPLLSKSKPKRIMVSPDKEIQSSNSNVLKNAESTDKSEFSSEGFDTDLLEFSEDWETRLPKPMSNLNSSKIQSQASNLNASKMQSQASNLNASKMQSHASNLNASKMQSQASTVRSKTANTTIQNRSSISNSSMNITASTSASTISSVGILNKNNKKQSSQLSKAHVLVSSTEISGATAIVSSLRHGHALDVSVVQLQHADYVVSTRMAVVRQLHSVFSSASHKTKLVQCVQGLLAAYERPIVIIEADRVKKGESPRQSGRNKYLDTIVCAFAQVTQLKLLYSNNQGETSDILKSLAEQERSKEHNIPVSATVLQHLEQKIDFYRTLPEVSYPTAICLANTFPNIITFMKCSVSVIEEEGRMSQSKASALHTFLHRKFRRDMLPPSARK